MGLRNVGRRRPRFIIYSPQSWQHVPGCGTLLSSRHSASALRTRLDGWRGESTLEGAFIMGIYINPNGTSAEVGPGLGVIRVVARPSAPSTATRGASQRIQQAQAARRQSAHTRDDPEYHQCIARGGGSVCEILEAPAGFGGWRADCGPDEYEVEVDHGHNTCETMSRDERDARDAAAAREQARRQQAAEQQRQRQQQQQNAAAAAARATAGARAPLAARAANTPGLTRPVLLPVPRPALPARPIR